MWEPREIAEGCLPLDPSTTRSKRDSASKAACVSYAKRRELATGHFSRKVHRHDYMLDVQTEHNSVQRYKPIETQAYVFFCGQT